MTEEEKVEDEDSGKRRKATKYLFQEVSVYCGFVLASMFLHTGSTLGPQLMWYLQTKKDVKCQDEGKNQATIIRKKRDKIEFYSRLLPYKQALYGSSKFLFLFPEKVELAKKCSINKD